MVKKRTRNEDKAPELERKVSSLNLIELRPGLFLNQDHIVSLRVLPNEEGGVYAVLQLSSGDKMNLTRDEFTAISGEDPRPPARVPLQEMAK